MTAVPNLGAWDGWSQWRNRLREVNETLGSHCGLDERFNRREDRGSGPTSVEDSGHRNGENEERTGTK